MLSLAARHARACPFSQGKRKKEKKERHSRSRKYHWWTVKSPARRRVAKRSRITRDEASNDTKKSPFLPTPLLAPTRCERGRENIAVGVRVSRGRTPCASSPSPVSPPRGTSGSTAADYTGGCPAIVTLALLIACPTKVYHHRHPSCPPSALNPLVSRCTYCSVFLSLRRRSPFPSATYHSSRARLSTLPSPSLSPSFILSLSPRTFSVPLFITTWTHTRISRFRARYYQAWKLRPALFELFATVLIRFILAAWPRQAAWIQFHPQLSPRTFLAACEINRHPRGTCIYIAANHSPTD